MSRYSAQAGAVNELLDGWLDELDRKGIDEQRRTMIRLRADGAIMAAQYAGIYNRERATEWQNKFIAAMMNH